MSFNRIMMESFVNVGLEEDVYGGDVVAATPEQVDATIDELAGTEEGEDAIQELSDIDTAISATDTATDGLGVVAEALESYRAAGGMDEQAARLFNAAVAAITAPVGGRMAKPMPSLESYNSAGGRLASTTVALEGIRETMAKYVEAVIGFISRMWQAVKGWIKGMFSKEGRYKKAIEAFAKMVEEKITPEHVKDKDAVKVSNVVGQWVGGTKNVISAANITAIGSSYTGFVERMKTAYGKQHALLTKSIEDTISLKGDEKFEFDKIRKEMGDKATAALKLLAGIGDQTTAKTFKAWFKDYDVYVIQPIKVGTYSALAIGIEKTKGYVGNAYVTGGYRILRPEMDSSTTITEVEAFNTGAPVVEYAKALLAITKLRDASIKATEVLVESMEASTKKVCDMVMKEVRKSEDSTMDERVLLKEELRSMSKFATSNKNALTGAYNWLVESWGHALAYGNAQYKNLKKPEKPA